VRSLGAVIGTRVRLGDRLVLFPCLYEGKVYIMFLGVLFYAC